MAQYSKPGASKYLVIATIVVAVLGAGMSYFLFAGKGNGAQTPGAQSSEQRAAAPYTAQEVLVAVNKARVEAGVGKLSPISELEEAAKLKAKHMDEKQYFSHFSQDDGKQWADFVEEVGYEYTEAGENLAKGYNSVEEMVETWLLSPTHKANMLSETYENTGIAVLPSNLNGTDTVLVVQLFSKE